MFIHELVIFQAPCAMGASAFEYAAALVVEANMGKQSMKKNPLILM